jgi:hypothetical protein
MKKLIIKILITNFVFLLACDKKNKETEKINIPDIAMSYLAPAGEGSYYVYKDNFTLEVDTFSLDYFSELFIAGMVGSAPNCGENTAYQTIRYDLINIENQNDNYMISFYTNCSADSLSGSFSKGPATGGYLELNSIDDIFYSNDTINSGGAMIYMQDTLHLENYLFTDVLVFNVDITAGSLGDLYFVKDIGLVKAKRLELINYNLKP